MPDFYRDQADGLRRMFRRAPAVVAVAGVRPGSGATRVACTLALELAARGVAVTLIDEHRGEANATALLRARARFDLWQAVNGDARVSQTMVWAEENLRVVPAARLAQHPEQLDDARQARLEQCWKVVAAGSDAFVIDARLSEDGRLSPLAARAGQFALVGGSDSAAVMGAYLVLKQIALRHAPPNLGMVINRAADASQAQRIADNLGGLLHAQLGRRLDVFGWLPRVAQWHRGEAMTRNAPPLPGLEALLSRGGAPAPHPAELASKKNAIHPGGSPATSMCAA